MKNKRGERGRSRRKGGERQRGEREKKEEELGNRGEKKKRGRKNKTALDILIWKLICREMEWPVFERPFYCISVMQLTHPPISWSHPIDTDLLFIKRQHFLFYVQRTVALYSQLLSVMWCVFDRDVTLSLRTLLDKIMEASKDRFLLITNWLLI